MYIETSGTGGPYTLTSECLDISALFVQHLDSITICMVHQWER